jgi:hypothetical protein
MLFKKRPVASKKLTALRRLGIQASLFNVIASNKIKDTAWN